jgi:glycerophosphoryl diester phosphodiesterase
MRFRPEIASLILLSAISGSVADAQIIVAHRGASHDAPENTLAAFNLAWEQGADGVEADFYLTSDGKIICLHDKDTQRTAGVKHVVSETPFDVLRQLDVGSWKGEDFRGERMPTIEEVIATIPKGKKFVIELKTGPEIVTPLAAALKKSSLERNQILIIAFNAETVAECKRQMPAVKVHWLVRYEQDKKTCAWTPTRETVQTTLKRIKADGLGTQGNPEHVDAEFLQELCDAGLCEWHVWTLDDPSVARFYQKLGPFGITTNRPGWLREELKKLATAAPDSAAAAAPAK